MRTSSEAPAIHESPAIHEAPAGQKTPFIYGDSFSKGALRPYTKCRTRNTAPETMKAANEAQVTVAHGMHCLLWLAVLPQVLLTLVDSPR